MSLSSQSEIRSAHCGNTVLRWRPLGQYEDLSVDFHNNDRVEIAVQVLDNCLLNKQSQQLDDDAIRRLTLSGRIGALIAVYWLTFERDQLDILHHCQISSCAEIFETRLPLETLFEMAREAEQSPILDVDLGQGEPLRLRRPTGIDQKKWQSRCYASENEATQYMLSTLVLDRSTIIYDQTNSLADALEEQDSLVSFKLLCNCPFCGQEITIPLDLEALLLNELKKAQMKLLHDVHVIASCYGWTEKQILSTPSDRRNHYIELIQSGSVQ